MHTKKSKNSFPRPYKPFADKEQMEGFQKTSEDGLKKTEETNKDFHAVQALIQYNKPLYFDDEIQIGLKIKEIRNTSMTWIMGMFIKETGELVSASEIVHVYTDMKTNKPTKITDDLKKKFGVS